MSLSRKIVVTIFVIVLSALSTVLTAPEAGAVADTEKPLSTVPVVQGPVALKLPAMSVTHPVPQKPQLALGEVKSAVANIVTQNKVVAQLKAVKARGEIQAVIDFALAQIGDPYVWGGNGPNGWDCSGLMVGAYKQIGVNLPRTSRAQYGIGTPVAYGQWQPGDLLFFGSSAGSIHHVVMYIGNGQIVHASTFGVPVKTAPVSGGGGDYFGAKRVV